MLSPSVTCAGPVFVIRRSGGGTTIVIASLKAGSSRPFVRNLTVQWYVPASVPAPTETVSLNGNVSPLVPLRLGGVTEAETPGSQATVWVTVTGRFESPVRIAAATWSFVALGKKLPPVAAAIALAWPLAFSPSPKPLDTLTATTRIEAAWSAAIVWASVWPPLGSCPDASPNHATMRDEPGRNAVAGLDASSNSAFSCASGVSQPSPVAHWLIPACAAGIDAVIAWFRR